MVQKNNHIFKIFVSIIYFIVLFLITTPYSFGQDLIQALTTDIEDGSLDEFSKIEAAFIISGARDHNRLQQGLQWFEDLIADIQSKNLIGFDKVASAEKLFLYFHSTWLETYKEKATTLFDIKDQRRYNCVSATVLYNLTCDQLQLSTKAFETPTHVYTIFTNFTEHVMVENTTSMGFNIMKNLDNYSRYLAQYYPDQMALKIGLDKLYYHENSKGREINNTELLGLICYNLAISNSEKINFAEAYNYVELAQLFNSDSRSNRRFEINLYYNWGQQLFNKKNFFQAFDVTADAFYRYPDNDDFKKNCQIAFTNALSQLWLEKDWDRTEQIILEMDDLNILSDQNRLSQKNVLLNWLKHFEISNDRKNFNRANQLFQSYHANR